MQVLQIQEFAKRMQINLRVSNMASIIYKDWIQLFRGESARSDRNQKVRAWMFTCEEPIRPETPAVGSPAEFYHEVGATEGGPHSVTVPVSVRAA